MNNTGMGHDTGLRIIEVMKILLENDLSKKDIIDKIKSSGKIGGASTSEAYIKYFNTFEQLGFDIERSKNYYRLKNAFVRAELTDKEKAVLLKIIKTVIKSEDKKRREVLKHFIIKLGKYFNMDLNAEFQKREEEAAKELNKSKNFNTAGVLKSIMKTHCEAEITFKPKGSFEPETITAEINAVKESGGRYYAVLSNSEMKRSRRIYADTVISVKPSEERNEEKKPASAVIYEFTGRPAKSYRIKQWEILEDFGDDFLRIRNEKEDLKTLLPRILKYGGNCRILYPEHTVKEFLKLTKDVLKNLRENI